MCWSPMLSQITGNLEGKKVQAQIFRISNKIVDIPVIRPYSLPIPPLIPMAQYCLGGERETCLQIAYMQPKMERLLKTSVLTYFVSDCWSNSWVNFYKQLFRSKTKATEINTVLAIKAVQKKHKNVHHRALCCLWVNDKKQERGQQGKEDIQI